MHKKSLVDQRGFSIIDTVLAIVIIGIVIGSITLIMTSINTANVRSQNIADANNILNTITEGFKSAKYDSIPIVTDDEYDLGDPPFDDYVVNSSLYNPSATVTVVESDTKKTIHVKVQYENLGNEKAVEDTIIISKYGVSQ